MSQHRFLASQGQEVSYRVYRSARRSIGLRIDRRGLTVGAPHQASLREIEALLRQHQDWLLEKLADWAAKAQQQERPLTDGDIIPWLGAPLALRIAPEVRRCQWMADRLELPSLPDAELKALLTERIRARARAFLPARIAHYAAILGVPPPPCQLSSAHSRWGSCNSKGKIRLSWRLMHFAPELIDYVVAHELAHLQEMNHSPRFWAIVERLYPDWKKARAEIRRLTPTLPQLAP
ncbi:MAG: M48 family metallopeptidase [Zoogloeaceae bacterium]|jgi:predicted metal-dependent hydrolase|nr:M48 family metallopeptidase [Zoogloeaceae bacterium]